MVNLSYTNIRPAESFKKRNTSTTSPFLSKRFRLRFLSFHLPFILLQPLFSLCACMSFFSSTIMGFYWSSTRNERKKWKVICLPWNGTKKKQESDLLLCLAFCDTKKPDRSCIFLRFPYWVMRWIFHVNYFLSAFMTLFSIGILFHYVFVLRRTKQKNIKYQTKRAEP